MKKLIILIASFVLISCNCELESLIFKHFQKFIKKYNKKYSSINEYLARYQVFRNNLMSIINSEKSSFKSGINQFSDLTEQEFSKTYLNLNFDAIATINMSPYIVKNTKSAPPSYDWRNYGRVGGLRELGSCTATWALVAIENLEGLYYSLKGKFEYLSIQMLIDCDTKDSGCNGGLMEYAFAWIKSNGGKVMLEKDYPYVGYKSECKYDESKTVDMRVTGYKKLGSSWSTFSPVDEDEIKEFLYETGPLAIALNAKMLQTYSSGIIDATSTQCPSSGINHAVLLVGYGTDSTIGLDYWIAQNSWGKSWGESGYFRIRRGNGTCGVNCYITTAIVS